jgi:hypothetical protein
LNELQTALPALSFPNLSSKLDIVKVRLEKKNYLDGVTTVNLALQSVECVSVWEYLKDDNSPVTQINFSLMFRHLSPDEKKVMLRLFEKINEEKETVEQFKNLMNDYFPKEIEDGPYPVKQRMNLLLSED